MEFLNKWLKLNNMDGLVPTLEMEDLYQEDGPLLKDHFLGVDGLSGDQPLCVAFVDPNTQHINGELYGHNPTNGFYDEYTAPSWLEDNVDLNDLDSMAKTYSFPASVSTIPFVEPPVSQTLIPDTTYGYENIPKVAYAAQEAKQIQPQMKKNAYEASEMEHDYYYDASPESMAESISSWNSSTEEEYPSKAAILEEIHREAAEIERFSVSPPANKVSKKSKIIMKKPSKPQKMRSASIPKPYVERKKELNRQAATKYREKKRTEKENLHHEREHLETRNTELKAEVSALSSEIDYLKKLIKDIEARTKH